MKPLSKLAAAQLFVDRARARDNRLFQRRATRETVKALRVMADMLEAGEVSEWQVQRNFGYMPQTQSQTVMQHTRNERADELRIEFRYSLEKFAKRLRRRKRQS